VFLVVAFTLILIVSLLALRRSIARREYELPEEEEILPEPVTEPDYELPPAFQPTTVVAAAVDEELIWKYEGQKSDSESSMELTRAKITISEGEEEPDWLQVPRKKVVSALVQNNMLTET
jgi:hypothetical protein